MAVLTAQKSLTYKGLGRWFKYLEYLLFHREIDVIIPVYRGLHEVKACLESVLKYQQKQKFNLIIINDACPDPEINNYLDRLAAQHAEVTIIHNYKNLGFVASVNIGMALHQQRDVLLLNSDTIVAGDWLDRMHRCAYKAPQTGTVTPFSNNATICSFPVFCKNNKLLSKWSVEHLDQVFATVNRNISIKIPTAVGFCMYIKRECLNTVGLFDFENFGKGYGEENDFCMRAFKKGWQHLLCADTFVYHAGGVSFSTQKDERIATAMATMDRLHYGYHQCVHQHIAKNPAAHLRLSVICQLLHNSKCPLVLFISHNSGGGTEQHLQELADFLAESMDVIIIRPGSQGRTIFSLGPELEAESLYFYLPAELDKIIKICTFLGVSKIHFHHTMDVDTSLWELPRKLGVSYDITLHDYYFINANPKLTDQDGKFCTDKTSRDQICAQTYPLPEGITATAWRCKQIVLLEKAEHIFAPSNYMADLYQSYFPNIKLVKAFHPDWEKKAPYPQVHCHGLNKSNLLKIIVFGAISKEKGAELLENCAHKASLNNDPFEFHLLGYAFRPLHTSVIQHGAYQNEDLLRLISELEPDLIWFPAMWPETYSYTLSTAMQAGLPIVAPDIGAFPERLAQRPLTWIIPWDQNPDQWLAFFLSIKEKVTGAQEFTWNAQPCKDDQVFSYAEDYTGGLPLQKTGRLNSRWIQRFSQRNNLLHTLRFRHEVIFDWVQKIKKDRFGAYIIGLFPSELKTLIKSFLMVN